MFRLKANIINIVLICIPAISSAQNMILPENEKHKQVYYTQKDNKGRNAEIKGKVILVGADYNIKSDVVEKTQDKTNISIRLFENTGIEIGDVLYAINDYNLIIGKIAVTSVFKTATFGYLLLGKGNLRLVNIGDRIVQIVGEEHSKRTYAYKGKGDYFKETGETGEAISFYKNALEADKNNPEAHLSLGYIYLNDDTLEFAYNEFKEAEKQKRRLYDNEDKYLLYKGLAEVRFKQAYYLSLPNEFRNKYISEGIDNCKQALKLYPDSKEVNHYLSVFYYKNSQPSDIMAKDQFLKVLALDPNNIEACIALAELYERHNNKSKAALYAEKALKIDPANDKAKFILSKLK